MPKINVLPKEVSEMIAAGEVVERPASVIKELTENSIDAGADNITVEIQHGGIAYMRITDNGCGIAYDDVPLAFLRHATSKIRIEDDLNSISTLGFRGEALAAISSVSRVEILTKTPEGQFGTKYGISGGEQTEYCEAGCPDGTTLIVRDLFFNTPARMKFLKKDVSEANAVAAVVDRIALSHPEIAFKFIRDGKTVLNTSGDGSLKNTVYSVLGKDFATSIIEVNGENDGISVSGFVSKPVACRPTRNNQFTFLNGRLVRSGTVTAAVEQAYKNSAMIGKFPGFVLNIAVPCNTVDVNVHPAKTEVRFSDERRVFNAVYGAVKSALTVGDTRPQISVAKGFDRFLHSDAGQFKQQEISSPQTVAEKVYFTHNDVNKYRETPPLKSEPVTVLHDDNVPLFYRSPTVVQRQETQSVQPAQPVQKQEMPVPAPEADKIEETVEREYVRLIGEAFNTYIIAEKGNSIFMIDKHAAHERILFNKLKSEHTVEVQQLLSPVRVTLEKEEYNAVIGNIEIMLKSGFEVEDFGNGSILVRAVPSVLAGQDVEALIDEASNALLTTASVEIERLENLFHTVACKAAIKGGSITSDEEKLRLAEKVLSSNEIMYCPHGRPVAFEIKKQELEKQFGRIQ